MRQGMLHIRDVEGPKKTGSMETRLEAMEQQVFKCQGMVGRGLNAIHMMITEFTSKHKIDANDIGKHLSRLYDRIDQLEGQIYDLQNQNYDASQGSGSGGWKGKAVVNLETAMKNMMLKESECDAVIVGDEEISKFAEETRWLAVAKVNMAKSFGAESFKSTMKFIWWLAYELTIRDADDNVFIIQMFCVGDWNRVVHQGPWILRGLMVII
ncbi:hypothetical protein D1007_01319 [Hordeum vulgare]|nr:hypothetical protein D1007_01319 [Hordeum vulgare]